MPGCHRNFEDYVYEADGVEFWYARVLQTLPGYRGWQNFSKVIDKARKSSKNAENKVSDHFVNVNKMVTPGSGSEREISDNRGRSLC